MGSSHIVSHLPFTFHLHIFNLNPAQATSIIHIRLDTPFYEFTMSKGQKPFRMVLILTIFVCLAPLTCDLQHPTTPLKSDAEEVSLGRPAGSGGTADELVHSISDAWVDQPSENRRALDMSWFDVDSEPEERERKRSWRAKLSCSSMITPNWCIKCRVPRKNLLCGLQFRRQA